MIDTEEALEATEALVKGGIKLIEVTLDSPDSLITISELTNKYKNDEVVIGAGTVLDSESAKQAISAGADFLLSPSLNINFIKTCNRYDKVAIPGAMTPTEILTAKENGADIIKVFPAGNLGPSYLKSIKGPISSINLMATGGIDLENIVDFINSGSDSVGIGSSLVDKNLIKARKYKDLTKKAAEYVNKLKTI
jgi:2-dehydro-3-deoxyphosphogluconate aldolase/(4S)-4-hydroxy-2-oxoglutarate aldolase